MSNTKFYWLLLVLCIVATAIIVRQCQPAPEREVDTRVSKLLDRVSSDSVKLLQKDSVIERLLAGRANDSVKSEARYRRSVARTNAAINTVAEMKLKLDSTLNANPEIDDLVTAQDVIIGDLQAERDSLHADLLQERESFQEFRQEVATKDRIQARMSMDQSNVIAILQLDNSKLRKKNKGLKVLGVVGVVIAFVGGVAISN